LQPQPALTASRKSPLLAQRPPSQALLELVAGPVHLPEPQPASHCMSSVNVPVNSLKEDRSRRRGVSSYLTRSWPSLASEFMNPVPSIVSQPASRTTHLEAIALATCALYVLRIFNSLDIKCRHRLSARASVTTSSNAKPMARMNDEVRCSTGVRLFHARPNRELCKVRQVPCSPSRKEG
jgi:hypothetical protein